MRKPSCPVKLTAKMTVRFHWKVELLMYETWSVGLAARHVTPPTWPGYETWQFTCRLMEVAERCEIIGSNQNVGVPQRRKVCWGTHRHLLTPSSILPLYYHAAICEWFHHFTWQPHFSGVSYPHLCTLYAMHMCGETHRLSVRFIIKVQAFASGGLCILLKLAKVYA